ncbi:MAG TPA: hypothetical protein DD001_23220 [Microcoleaceae bacterium UBA10368]|nr:hypothetical protein [Microcoleaceae cyanobacterium UBA10368]
MSSRCLAKVFNLYRSSKGQYQISTYAITSPRIAPVGVIKNLKSQISNPMMGDRPHPGLCDFYHLIC